MRAILSVAIAALVLGGCQLASEPTPVDHFYRLSIADPPAGGTSLAGTVLVDRLDADGLMRERPVIYSADGGRLSLAQHEYDFWIEPPARLLQGELVRYLRTSGIARSIVTPELRVPSDFEVVGAVRRFERLIDRPGPCVSVRLDLALIDRNGDRPRVVESYAAETDCEDTSIGASVVAFNQALSQIFAAFLADIRQAGPAA